MSVFENEVKFMLHSEIEGNYLWYTVVLKIEVIAELSFSDRHFLYLTHGNALHI